MKQSIINVKNRNNLNMAVRLSQGDNPDKLAFIQHGFSGDKNEKHLVILEEKMVTLGYTVVIFDSTNSVNESDSTKEGITFTSHYNDLEDITIWAKQQQWYKEPFALGGHSMGATSIAFFAQNYPTLVNLLMPLSLAWGRGSSYEPQKDPKEMQDWKDNGYFYKYSSRRVEPFKVPYSFLEDLKTYDFIANADKITADTILIIGDQEHQVRLDDNTELFNKLTCKKELIILPGVPHALTKTKEHEDLYRKALDKVFD